MWARRLCRQELVETRLSVVHLAITVPLLRNVYERAAAAMKAGVAKVLVKRKRK